MFDDIFPTRLTELRNQKGVSARDMSLSIGQNPGYINNIETGKALPSMGAFFYICEFLDITPAEFFDTNLQAPTKIREVSNDLKYLNAEQLENIGSIVKNLISK